MQLSWLRTAMLGLTALAGTTSAVSLASFIPRIDNLPSQCASVYNSQIEGCKAEDFGDKAICSNACVQGLNKITQEVGRSCADVDVGETSIIGVFQNGLGIASLCPNTPVTIVTPSSSATTTVQTSTQAAAPTTQTVAATSTSTSTSISAAPQTSVAQSSSTSSAGIVIDPSATATLATSSVNTPQLNTASSSSKTNPTQVANSQLSNADSGGGSPFDVVATGLSSQLRGVPGSITALIATAVLFVVCT